MVQVYHFAKVLTDQSQVIEREENIPAKVQSIAFDSCSNAVMSDIHVSFNRGAQYLTVTSGQSLSVSAQAGTILELFGPGREENLKIKAVTSGSKVDILMVA